MLASWQGARGLHRDCQQCSARHIHYCSARGEVQCFTGRGAHPLYLFSSRIEEILNAVCEDARYIGLMCVTYETLL